MPQQELTLLAVLKDRLSGPGKRVRGTLKGIGNDAKKLQQQLAPLTGRVAALAGAFVGLQGARQSLELAERQVNAERQLLQALRGRTAEYANILKAASDIQKITRTGDEELIELAALLVNAGVAAEDIPKALQAAVDTSEALGVEIESVGKAIGLFSVGRAGELGERISELTELAAAGRLAGEGVDFLAVKFEGAAQAVAESEFGRAEQSLNTLGDTAEEVGKVLISVKNDALDALNESVAELAETVQSPAFRGFLKLISALLKQGIRLLPTIVKIGAAIAGVKLALWLVPLTAILIKFGFILFVVKEIVVFLFSIFNISVDIGKVWDDSKTSVTEWLEEIGKGERTVSDLFAELSLKSKASSAFFRLIWVSFTEFGKAAFKTVGGALNLFGASVGLVFLEMVNFFGEAVASMLHLVAVAVDEITNLTAKVRNLIPGLADVEGTSFALQFTGDFTGVDEDIERAKQDIEDGADALVNSFSRALENYKKEEARLLEETAEIVIDNEERRLEAQSRRIKSARELLINQEESERKIRANILAETESLERQLSDIRLGENLAVADKLRDIRVKELEILFNDKRISSAEFLQGVSEAQLATRSESLEKTRQEVEAILTKIALIREEKGADADVREQLRALLLLREREQQLIIETTEARFALVDLEKSLGQGLIDRAREARDTYKSVVEETAALLESGSILKPEALERNAEALRQFEKALSAINVELTELSAGAGEDAASFFERVAVAIGVIFEGVEEPEGGFLSGFTAGVDNAAASLDTLTELGLALGDAFTSTLADGVVDAFLEADFTFKKFAQNFLKLMLQMIIRAIALKAITASLGFVGLNSGGPVPGLAHGGPIPGPNVDADVTPIMGTPGEWVITRGSSQYYGDSIMSALNRRLIPRDVLAQFGTGARGPASQFLNDGGRVNESSQQQSGIQPAYIPPTNQTLERLLNGGKDAFIRFFRTIQPEL